MRRLWLVAPVVLAAGCMPLTTVNIKQHPQVISVVPNRVYKIWWNQMQECSGRRGDLSTVRFQVVEAAPGADLAGFEIDILPEGDVLGLWDARLRLISLGQRFLFDRGVVGHEMLHALGASHDLQLFRDRCGVYFS